MEVLHLYPHVSPLELSTSCHHFMQTQGAGWNVADTDTTDLHMYKAAAVKNWTLLSISFSGGSGGYAKHSLHTEADP